MKPARQKFQRRVIRLTGPQPRHSAITIIQGVPIDPVHPIEVVIQEEQRRRSLDQNAAYHAGPLRGIEQQAWIDGRQYSAKVLHEYFKAQFLPEEDDPELVDLVKDWHTYRKWDFTPSGERLCIGSTTQLTPKGFGQFMEQVCAFGAEHGVMFSASPNQMEGV